MSHATVTFEQPTRPRHVLLSDDDDDFCSLLHDALSDQGYRVTRVADGIALQRALVGESHDTRADPFDLVLTDVCMPRLSGLDALTAVPFETLPPVILMTAFGSSQTHEAAYRLGVSVVIDKPFDLCDFCTVVDCLLEKSRSSPKHQTVRPTPRSFSGLTRLMKQ